MMPVIPLRLLIACAGVGQLAGCGEPPAADVRPVDVARAKPAVGASAGQPVVVELFQSQGCSSCPPANANVNALATERPDVLALSFAVTYWDRLGWKDSFATPGNTARQWDYAHHAGREQVGTPQVIVNGRTAIVGSNRAHLEQTIRAAGPARGGPALDWDGRTLRIGSLGRAAAATVWLVRYDPRVIAMPIRAGENGGRTLPHRNIVRDLVKLGTWTGPAKTLTLPLPTQPDLASAILVQEDSGGPVVAALKIPS